MQHILKSVSIALQNIKANPLHTFLSTLGIIIGVAALVGILALGDGLEETGRRQLANTTSLNILTINSNSTTTINDVRVSVENRPVLTVQHVQEISSNYGQRAVTELGITRSVQASYGDSLTGVYLYAGTEKAQNLTTDSVKYGKFFTAEDVAGSMPVAVITHQLATIWSELPEELIGRQFLLLGEEFTIKGILQEKEFDMPRVAIPISVYLNKEPDSYPSITMKVLSAEEIPEIQEEIKQWLGETFEEGEEAFTVSSNEFRVEQFSRGILMFKLIMGAITGISVLVGGIGVMNVLLISVTERTKEIGIRKATGAKKKDIVFQFMAESVTISLVGCVIGALVGIAGVFAFVPIVNAVAGWEFSAAVSGGTLGIILVIALVIGVVFGTYPAWRASQLDPIDAIRHE